MLRLTLRLDVGGRATLGPGKARLLELIGETGSISAAGRAMGMSYRRAWTLVDSLNASFAAPLVAARPGGAGGGGAGQLPLGAPGGRGRPALPSIGTGRCKRRRRRAGAAASRAGRAAVLSPGRRPQSRLAASHFRVMLKCA